MLNILTPVVVDAADAVVAEKAEDEVAAAIAGAERKEEIEVAAAGRGKDKRAGDQDDRGTRGIQTTPFRLWALKPLAKRCHRKKSENYSTINLTTFRCLPTATLRKYSP